MLKDSNQPSGDFSDSSVDCNDQNSQYNRNMLITKRANSGKNALLESSLGVEKKQPLLLHNQVYRNLFEFVKEESTDPGSAEQGETENKTGLNRSQFVSKKVKPSKSIEPPEKEPTHLTRFGTFDLTNEGTNYINSSKRNLIALIKQDDTKIIKESSYSVGFPFQNYLFSQNRSIRESTKTLTHIMKVKKGVEYSLYSLKQPSLDQILLKKSCFEDLAPLPKGKTKTLVLDLDGTIIWTSSKMDQPDATFETINSEGRRTQLGVKKRPYLKEMFETISKVFEIMIFTASTKQYAQEIRKVIDPENKYISHMYTRQDCLQTKNGFFIKDLRVIERDLSNVLIVDNLVHSFGLQLDHGIPILDFKGEAEDEELYYLTEYLMELSAVPDSELIDKNRGYFRLKEILRADLDQI